MRRALAFLTFVLLCAPSAGQAAGRDPYRPLQWGLDKIHADTAWKATMGSGAIVAVIDTGVDLSHPDLAGRLLAGKDFVDGDDEPDDENGHGTLIAGIVAARSNNGVGVASTAPSARILPVRALDRRGTGVTDDVVAAIDWSVEQGAHVINLSLAQEETQGSLFGEIAVDQAIKRAANAGATVVVAAGNNHAGGRPQTAYDATVRGVVVVGASTKGDKRAAYSNYGAGLDLVAPGGGSATDPSADRGCTDTDAIVSTWWDPDADRSTYGAGCGTSMAVGFVSGVAALLHAEGLTNAQAVERMTSTAVDLGAKGRDDVTGYGRLDAARALGVKVTRARVAPKPTTTKRGSSVRTTGSVATKPTTTSTKPARTRPVVEPPAVVTPPTSGLPDHGWPASAAALMLSGVALAHVWRASLRGRAPR